LLAVGVSVYVATQKGDYDVTVTRLINTPRNIAYNYVNDFRNWPQWTAFDADMQPEFKSVTAGKGGAFSWEGDENDGAVKTIRTAENDSIIQQMDWNGMPAELRWRFEPSGKKTKVTLHVKGKMGFMPKVRATLKGGPNRIMETMYEQSLAKLDKTLDFEINTYKITIDGLVDKPGQPYLYQSITSTIGNLQMNIAIMMDKMKRFFSKNDITPAGKPFVLYDYYDDKKGLTKFAVCIPVREEVFTMPGSDISSGKFASYQAVKTTLHGDYSHLREAWDKTFAYIDTNKLTAAEASYIELYSVGKSSGKGPSKWVTEIYIPVLAAPVVPVAPVAARPSAPASKPDPVPTEPSTEELSIP